MKKIIVAYWHTTKLPNLDLVHKSEYSYSYEKRNEIVDKILDVGYSVMLRPYSDELVIWIDNGRFGQR